MARHWNQNNTVNNKELHKNLNVNSYVPDQLYISILFFRAAITLVNWFQISTLYNVKYLESC